MGVERPGMRVSLSHIADDEWRAMFAGARAAPRAGRMTPVEIEVLPAALAVVVV